VLDAEIRPGIELILDLIDFDDKVVGADLVVTGEGSLDEQSLAGKAPVGVARAAAKAGVPVIAVAGRLQLSEQRLQQAGSPPRTRCQPSSPTPPAVSRMQAAAATGGTHIAKDWLPTAS
jgi:glycerate kinase